MVTYWHGLESSIKVLPILGLVIGPGAGDFRPAALNLSLIRLEFGSNLPAVHPSI
jgi:hypothetical protein